MSLYTASIEDMQAWARGKMQMLPDVVIGGADHPYLERWWIIPRNASCNVYLHRILRSDDDRALHDHPWMNTSYILLGRYREITPEGEFIREAGSMIEREASSLHRLELIDDQPCISLFITGPKVREWGFQCPQGWVHWRDFTAGENGETVGRGCGEAD